MKYLYTESLANTVVLYLLIKKLQAPFDTWEAFKLGIIDKDGKKIKEPKSFKERESWTMFDKFVANLKKILRKFVGPSRFAAIATAALLLRDSKEICNNLILECNSLDVNTQLKLLNLINSSEIESIDFKNDQEFEFMLNKHINNISEEQIEFLKEMS